MRETVNLGELSGLPIELEGLSIRFGDGLPAVAPSVRRLEEMREVLYNQTARGPDELYYMYRGVFLPEHREMAAAHRVRYDITVIRPGKIGGEYVKTAGHYHPSAPGGEMAYPEVYEVLHGRAHYLLQRPEGDPASIADVIVVDAAPGDKVFIPPGYGHVTINPGEGPLVMTNCVASTFSSEYEQYRITRGAAYYEVESGNRGMFVPNDRYRLKPAPRLVKPVDAPALGLHAGVPLYRCFTSEPERFAFLERPQDFAGLFAGLYG
ncbi:MAG: glucose-6-phosphate isomerase [Firmicutes bacterium]|jgi:glucose-6-phosphate isomerase|nr:glucose-6-phosphate isomerase [Bacillota bacterium]